MTRPVELIHENLTRQVIGAAMNVHAAIGPGLLESAYEACLALELMNRGLMVERQVELPIHYKGTQVDGGYKLDIVVERQIVVELKAVERVLPIHIAQLMTYLKLSGRRVGLLINFNVQSLKEGITRRVI